MAIMAASLFRNLTLGVATLALAASPAVGQGKGGGNDGGQEKGGGQPGGQPGKQGGGKAPDGGNGGKRSERGPAPGHAAGQPDSGSKGPDRQASKAKPDDRGPDREPQGKDWSGNRGGAPDKGAKALRDGPGNPARGDDRMVDLRGPNRSSSGPFRWSSAPRRNLLDGCPPGLAKKNNGCTPPGLARGDPWQATYSRPDWWGYRGLTGGGYNYHDGYLVRYDGGRAASYIPLLGGALGIGGLWPSSYEPVDLPEYYEDYYGLGPSYRYADDVIYRVDPQTDTINSIAALLIGDDLGIGQPLPDEYGVYNVPYEYRDRYADSPDALYRYSDGYVYEVDPTTRLIQTAIELIS